MATSKKNYPLPKFHFEVEWGGARMGFTEVSGLDFETEVIEYREGNSLQLSKVKMPGLQKFCNVTLKRGMFLGDFDFFKWWRETTRYMSGAFRRTVVIKLLDDEHKPIISWSLQRAWPCKIQCPDLKADANEVAIESMELAHEGLSIIEAE